MKAFTLAVMAAIAFGGQSHANNFFETTGVPVGCGENTCCEPSCTAYWKDSKGCNGVGVIAGNCEEAFSPKDDTSDTGVDVCDGAGMFFCHTGHDDAIFVINREQQVSAAYVPHPDVCTLHGQCAPCDSQHFCGRPVYIGDIGADNHNCAHLTKKLKNAHNKPKRC